MTNKLAKILLVEDEEDIRVIAKLSLEQLGHYTVKYCASGAEALQCVEEFAPDLVLLDMMMPVMDGVTTLKALKKIPSLSKTPVVFITAKVLNNEIESYIALGAAAVIAKPFDPTTLPEQLNKIWLKNQIH